MPVGGPYHATVSELESSPLSPTGCVSSEGPETSPSDKRFPDSQGKPLHCTPLLFILFLLTSGLGTVSTGTVPSLRRSAWCLLIQRVCVSITEHSLSGTVRVCNVGFEKSVHVQVTFDSWRSHRDIACSYLHRLYSDFRTDVFAFDVPLPQNLDPSERHEFCVSFRLGSGDTPCWDNNKGQNYRVCVKLDGSGYSHSQAPLWHCITTSSVPLMAKEQRNQPKEPHVP